MTSDPTDSVPTTASDVSLLAPDGVSLTGRLFEPLGPARGTLLIHSATAVPQTFYAPFAKHAAARGFRVLTYDYRGIGRSRPASLRGFRATMSDWALLDARTALEFVKNEIEPGPVAAIGHSFGAQLVGLVDEMRNVDAAVFVAGQLGWYGHWPWAQRLTLSALWSAVPSITRTFGHLPGWTGLGVDLPAGVANEWASWCRHPRYLMRDYEHARERYGRFDVPLLSYAMSDDFFAPESAVSALLELLPRDRQNVRRVSPRDFGGQAIGHFGLFRRAYRDSLWQELLGFVEDTFESREPTAPVERLRAAADPLVTAEEILSDLSYGRV